MARKLFGSLEDLRRTACSLRAGNRESVHLSVPPARRGRSIKPVYDCQCCVLWLRPCSACVTSAESQRGGVRPQRVIKIRLRVPVQRTENSGRFTRGKVSSNNSTAQPKSPPPPPPPPPQPPPPCVQCLRVSIPPAVRPTLLRQIRMESLTCAQVWVRAVHAKGGQAQKKSAHELTGIHIKQNVIVSAWQKIQRTPNTFKLKTTQSP